ncbi:MAG: tRNA (adenosine(37)-N6)-threonylcarbamoyltransferase complex ATPase subunit type 1 TsaE, partial [Pseudomonadota bacterium]
MDAPSDTVVTADSAVPAQANTYVWRIGETDLERLERLAELLAAQIAAPAVIALRGPLGAGKTTFARHLIRAVAADRTTEVTSPTYAIQQVYETA